MKFSTIEHCVQWWRFSVVMTWGLPARVKVDTGLLTQPTAKNGESVNHLAQTLGAYVCRCG